MRSSTVGKVSSIMAHIHSSTNAGTSSPYRSSGAMVCGRSGFHGLTIQAQASPTTAM
jgi:hypothetical protein